MKTESFAPSDRTRVYLVDDHPLVRRALAQLINAEPDMTVCGEAGDAESAFAEILRLKPDVATVDISLGGNSGLDLIKRLRVAAPQIRSIVLTMHAEIAYAARSLNSGARGFVLKGDAPERVIESIRRVRSGRIFASDTVAAKLLDLTNGGRMPENPLDVLSDREREIAELIGQGRTTRETAARLHLSIKTVETHRAHLKRKLHLENAVRLVQFCAQWAHELRPAGNAAAR